MHLRQGLDHQVGPVAQVRVGAHEYGAEGDRRQQLGARRVRDQRVQRLQGSELSQVLN